MVSFPAEFPFGRRKPEPAPQPVAPVEECGAAWETAERAAEPPREEPTAEAVAPAIGPVEHAVAPVAPVSNTAPPPAAAAPVPAPAAIAPTPSRLIERRKVKRDPMSAGALVKLDSFHGPPFKVALSDISVAGVRFRSAQPMDPGEKAQIRIEVGPLRWTTRLRIVHCERDPDGANTVGCAFLRTELLRPWPATAA